MHVLGGVPRAHLPADARSGRSEGRRQHEVAIGGERIEVRRAGDKLWIIDAEWSNQCRPKSEVVVSPETPCSVIGDLLFLRTLL